MLPNSRSWPGSLSCLQPTPSHLPNAAVLMWVPAIPPPHHVPRPKQACQGRAGNTRQCMLPVEVESILGSPKTRPCSTNTGHGCPLLGSSRWLSVPCPGSPVGACVGCSAAGVLEGEHAGSSPYATCLDAGAGGPGSRAAEDPKPVPSLGTIHQGVHPASWYLSDLPFLFQLLLLRWLLDSLGPEGALCPLPVLQGQGLCGCHSMVQACLVCSRVHNGSLTTWAARADMDKTDKPSPSAKKHVRLQER